VNWQGAAGFPVAPFFYWPRPRWRRTIHRVKLGWPQPTIAMPPHSVRECSERVSGCSSIAHFGPCLHPSGSGLRPHFWWPAIVRRSALPGTGIAGQAARAPYQARLPGLHRTRPRRFTGFLQLIQFFQSIQDEATSQNSAARPGPSKSNQKSKIENRKCSGPVLRSRRRAGG